VPSIRIWIPLDELDKLGDTDIEVRPGGRLQARAEQHDDKTIAAIQL
jgi:hypothetical protein